jgi:hypothetical protein
MTLRHIWQLQWRNKCVRFSFLATISYVVICECFAASQNLKTTPHWHKSHQWNAEADQAASSSSSTPTGTNPAPTTKTTKPSVQERQLPLQWNGFAYCLDILFDIVGSDFLYHAFQSYSYSLYLCLLVNWYSWSSSLRSTNLAFNASFVKKAYSHNKAYNVNAISSTSPPPQNTRIRKGSVNVMFCGQATVCSKECFQDQPSTSSRTWGWKEGRPWEDTPGAAWRKGCLVQTWQISTQRILIVIGIAS